MFELYHWSQSLNHGFQVEISYFVDQILVTPIGEKLWPLKVEGIKNFKNQTTKRYKGWFLNTQKILCMFFFVAIRVQR